MNEKIFDKDVTYRAKVRVKAGSDEISSDLRPRASLPRRMWWNAVKARCTPPPASAIPSE